MMQPGNLAKLDKIDVMEKRIQVLERLVYHLVAHMPHGFFTHALTDEEKIDWTALADHHGPAS